MKIDMHGELPERKQVRLHPSVYRSNGVFFVTIVTQGKRHLFGEVRGGLLIPSVAGIMVAETWSELGRRWPRFVPRKLVVMPNHIHGTGYLEAFGTRAEGPPEDPTCIPSIVGHFKSVTTVRYVRGVRERGWTPFHRRLWQRGYWDRVIRGDRELQEIEEYIDRNPATWAFDRLR